jgi:hypothetical protein
MVAQRDSRITPEISIKTGSHIAFTFISSKPAEWSPKKLIATPAGANVE